MNMSIRIRKINGHTIAICAAISEAKEGDIYLHDGIHEALATKFSCDWNSTGMMKHDISDQRKIPLMRQEQGGKLV